MKRERKLSTSFLPGKKTGVFFLCFFGCNLFVFFWCVFWKKRHLMFEYLTWLEHTCLSWMASQMHTPQAAKQHSGVVLSTSLRGSIYSTEPPIAVHASPVTVPEGSCPSYSRSDVKTSRLKGGFNPFEKY